MHNDWSFSLVHAPRYIHFYWGRRGCDRMVVGFTPTRAISVYYHYSCKFEPRSWRGVLIIS